MNLPEGKLLIQFDGICILCSRTIQWVIRADHQKKFLFQALQNTSNRQESESVIVSDGKTIYSHFDAILKIGKELGGIYKLVAVFKILPSKWRLKFYEWIAKNRYHWFGKRTSCFLPSPEDRNRFI